MRKPIFINCRNCICVSMIKNYILKIVITNCIVEEIIFMINRLYLESSNGYKERLFYNNCPFIEDITNNKDKYRLARKYYTRCTDSFIWKYDSIVKYLNWMNNIEINYGVLMDYYMCNFFEINKDFKHYWSNDEFFIHGSNLGIIKTTLQD